MASRACVQSFCQRGIRGPQEDLRSLGVHTGKSAKRAGVKRACPNKAMAHIWFMHDVHLGCALFFLDMLAEYTLLSMTVMVTPCLWYVVGMNLVCPMPKFPQAPFARAPFGESRVHTGKLTQLFFLDLSLTQPTFSSSRAYLSDSRLRIFPKRPLLAIFCGGRSACQISRISKLNSLVALDPGAKDIPNSILESRLTSHTKDSCARWPRNWNQKKTGSRTGTTGTVLQKSKSEQSPSL